VAIDPRETGDPLHEALTRLPLPQAPRTLLPRVMAAVAQAERAREDDANGPWFAWPVEWRIGSAAALVFFAAAAAWIWPGVERAATALIASGLRTAAGFAPGAAALAHLVSVMWEAFVQPVAGFVVVWMVVMSAACAAFVAALERVAFGEASQ
jgi:hypothetical protein